MTVSNSGDINTDQTITIGQTIVSSLDFAADVDWYRIEITEAGSYRFQLFGSGPDGGVSDPILGVRDSTDTPRADSDDIDPGIDKNSLIVIDLEPGIYYVTVHRYEADSTLGSYTLAATRASDAPVNSQPRLTGDLTASIAEGGVVALTSVLLNGIDSDDSGDGLVFSVSNLLNGKILVEGVIGDSFTQTQLLAGLVVFQHDGSEGAAAGFNISLADGGEDGAYPSTGSMTFTVTPVDDPLVLGAPIPNQPLQPGVLWSFAIPASAFVDPDTDLVFSASLVGGQPLPAWITFDPATGTFSGTPPQDFTGGIQIVVEATNGIDTIPSVFSLSPYQVNVAPTLGGGLTGTLAEGGTLLLTTTILDGIDPDDSADDLLFTISNLQHGSLLVNGVEVTTFTLAQLAAGLVVFRHDGTEGAAASFHVVLADGGEDGALPVNGDVTFAITPVNDAPVLAVGLTGIVAEGGAIVLTTAILSGVDFDDSGNGLVFTVSNLQHGVVLVDGVVSTSFTQTQLEAGLVSLRHDGSEGAAAGFDVSLADGREDGAAPAQGVVTFTVTPLNDVPETNVTLSDQVFVRDTLWIFAVPPQTFVDPDGTLTLSARLTDGGALPAWIYFDTTNNTFYGMPPTGWKGSLDIALMASDGIANASTTFMVAAPPNEAPVISGGLTGTLSEGETLVLTSGIIDGLDVDDSFDGLAFTVSDLHNGVILVNGLESNTFTRTQLHAGSVVFRHDGSETNAASFHLSLSDGALIDDADVSFTILPVNDAPVVALSIQDQTAATGAEWTFEVPDGTFVDGDSTLTLSANLSNGDPLPSWLNFNKQDGRFTGTPPAGWNGPLALSVSASDGAASVTSHFMLTLLPEPSVNTAPEITGTLAANLNEGDSLTLTSAMLDGSDPDDSYDGLVFTATNLQHGAILVNGVASNHFTQTQLRAGSVVFRHDGSDGNAASFHVSLADGGENGAGPDAADVTFTVAPVNDAPIVAKELTNQTLAPNVPWMFTVPAGTFADVDSVLVLSATLAGGQALPAWIAFDPTTKTFSGTPPADWVGSLALTLKASDGDADVSSTFTITHQESPHSVPTISLSGGAILENASPGNFVGAFSAANLEYDTFTFTLVDDAGGRFALSGGNLVVAQGALLDYENAANHRIVVRASFDSLSDEKTFLVTVNDILVEEIRGTAGRDSLEGGSGRDILYGMAGKDLLKGGGGGDVFAFTTRAKKNDVDKIIDFNVKDDTIWLENAVFKTLGKKGSITQPTLIKKAFFYAGSAAHDKDDHIIYNKKTGALFYDSDGIGGATQIQVATLSKKPSLTVKDFFVI